MFRNLRHQYQNDLDQHFLKQFNKSTINLRCENQKSPFAIRKHLSKVNIAFQSKLNEFSQFNDKISKFSKIKYYVRSRSSQNTQEGHLNQRDQQILLSLPFHSIKMHQREGITKLWRKHIFLVIFLLRYKKDQSEQFKLNLQTRHLQLGTPKIPIDTTRKRRRNAGSQFKLSTFAEYIDAQDNKQESKTKRSEDEKFKKSPVYQSFKYNDIRICRLLRLRNNSVRTSNAESPLKINQQVAKSNKLPPLLQIDRRMQRVYSNFAK
ncbi:unnamed protein product (macronuclear) [Paramecium tetraurelia]|uniref:Uncharacterized protein n=1 Tax=Paramecium tetraurelia TaxID=5888 RepID=A0BW69_PARTE|nr:uncharacterized protein GSPATT00032638001 [Paramecium tetraurelia]CAK62786.1 unnamed protein product [Paramecium tetraurelia]|eukprot:XP_001430184.1 hypothetical protein (macronuclear) [Paramecium tetraurelia strain d4-2]